MKSLSDTNYAIIGNEQGENINEGTNFNTSQDLKFEIHNFGL